MEWRQVTLVWAEELMGLYFDVALHIVSFSNIKTVNLSICEWDFPQMLQECFCSIFLVYKCYI